MPEDTLDLSDVVVGLIGTLQDLEAVPCRSTEDVLRSLTTTLIDTQQVPCDCTEQLLVELEGILDGLQAVAIGVSAALIASMTGLLTTIPSEPMMPPQTPGEPPQPVTIPTTPPVPVPVPPIGPGGVPIPVPVRPAAQCSVGAAPSPEPDEPVAIDPQCAAVLVALGGPIAERLMNDWDRSQTVHGQGVAATLAPYVDGLYSRLAAASSLDAMMTVLHDGSGAF